MAWKLGVTLGAAALAHLMMPSSTAQAAGSSAATGDILIEFHFKPVANAQIALWLATPDGNVVKQVMVTQATATLGIGNRPGRRDFLSSWRFPYGPREGVLPIWAHARDKDYPKLVFYDDDPSDQDSLGWHENSSSAEPYFCRPLSASEHETISTDTMTCPSPSVFQSDKGKFSTARSVYPPRGDLVEFEDGGDSADVPEFSTLNDLDMVTKATPVGGVPVLFTATIPEALAEGPLVAWIEVNLEDDQNTDWAFAREEHYIDPRLSGFGIPYLGQPSVVYKVEFNPARANFRGTDQYAGYSDLTGANGDIQDPDGSINVSEGSGADRLSIYTLNGQTFRFGVYSHGSPDAEPDPEDENDGWGACQPQNLPNMQGVELEPIDFDRVRVHFTVPATAGDDVMNVRLFYRKGAMPLGDENASSAIQQVPALDDCGPAVMPGVATWCDVDELFASTNYQVGVRYEDGCANASSIAAEAVTTPNQEFAMVDGFCIVATAAYGAPWADKVQALRWVRDAFLNKMPLGSALVRYYYYAGPPVARLVGTSAYTRAVARMVLKPLAELATLGTHAYFRAHEQD